MIIKTELPHTNAGRLHRSAHRLSDQLVRIEGPFAGMLIAGVFVVILANLVFRSMGWALYWADELAIYMMIWAALLGASISVKLRAGISVKLLPEFLSRSGRQRLQIILDVLILFSAISLLVLCWIWYDPVLLVRSGFDISAFKSTSFNFIYHEPTVTLQIKKYWLWLIMPFVAFTMSIHAGVNLLDSLGGRSVHSTGGDD